MVAVVTVAVEGSEMLVAIMMAVAVVGPEVVVMETMAGPAVAAEAAAASIVEEAVRQVASQAGAVYCRCPSVRETP